MAISPKRRTFENCRLNRTIQLPKEANTHSQMPFRLDDTLLWSVGITIVAALGAGLVVEFCYAAFGQFARPVTTVGLVAWGFVVLASIIYWVFLRRNHWDTEPEPWEEEVVIEHCWVPWTVARRVLYRLRRVPDLGIQEDRIHLITRRHKKVLVPTFALLGMATLMLCGILVLALYKHSGSFTVLTHNGRVNLGPWWWPQLVLFVLALVTGLVGVLKAIPWAVNFTILTPYRIILVIEPPWFLFFLESNVYSLMLEDVQELTQDSKNAGKFLHFGPVGANSPTDENKRFHGIADLPWPVVVHRLLDRAHQRIRATQNPWAHGQAIPVYTVPAEWGTVTTSK